MEKLANVAAIGGDAAALIAAVQQSRRHVHAGESCRSCSWSGQVRRAPCGAGCMGIAEPLTAEAETAAATAVQANHPGASQLSVS